MSIQDKIIARLSPLAALRLDIRDDSHRHAGHAGATSGGGHFDLVIVSSAFQGQNPVARHRQVYALLSGLIPAEIHALSISALTPDEDKTSYQG
ncbi:BolA family protein [Uliginosibacterium gangwonense]|uniref:BolA family protein n=1 Tax=Uliginosibacterium gangwonense TaxID=392736 RepID=UPI0003674356|nr:BolA family protein [Uliginosibacterium gangwonense]